MTFIEKTISVFNIKTTRDGGTVWTGSNPGAEGPTIEVRVSFLRSHLSMLTAYHSNPPYYLPSSLMRTQTIPHHNNHSL